MRKIMYLGFIVFGSVVNVSALSDSATFYYTNLPNWPAGSDVNTPAIYNRSTQILNMFPAEDYLTPAHAYLYTFEGPLSDQGALFVTYGHQGMQGASCYLAGVTPVKDPKHPVYALSWDNTHPDSIRLSCQEVTSMIANGI